MQCFGLIQYFFLVSVKIIQAIRLLHTSVHECFSASFLQSLILFTLSRSFPVPRTFTSTHSFLYSLYRPVLSPFIHCLYLHSFQSIS